MASIVLPVLLVHPADGVDGVLFATCEGCSAISARSRAKRWRRKTRGVLEEHRLTIILPSLLAFPSLGGGWWTHATCDGCRALIAAVAILTRPAHPPIALQSFAQRRALCPWAMARRMFEDPVRCSFQACLFLFLKEGGRGASCDLRWSRHYHGDRLRAMARRMFEVPFGRSPERNKLRSQAGIVD
jgi:hypothetical protein